MKEFFILLAFIIACSFASYAGIMNDSLPTIDLKLISRVNQGNSYITFPTDIGNIEPLWFEGNVIPNFI